MSTYTYVTKIHVLTRQNVVTAQTYVLCHILPVPFGWWKRNQKHVWHWNNSLTRTGTRGIFITVPQDAAWHTLPQPPSKRILEETVEEECWGLRAQMYLFGCLEGILMSTVKQYTAGKASKCEDPKGHEASFFLK